MTSILRNTSVPPIATVAGTAFDRPPLADEMRQTLQKECEERLLLVWRTIEAKVPATVSREQLDQALAHYVYGLTRPLYADRPAEQLGAIVDLMVKTLPTARVDHAIHSKETYDERFSGICESLVRLGERDALTVLHSNWFSSFSSEQSPVHDAPGGAGEREGISTWRRPL
ncbi:hypothetical protein [Rhizobium rhizogenes]|uniref:hypothetical protein n=1 Tax=Rhizobium rhizogenes TaxID=359 RepID=UPI001F1A1DA6|nr:hypothetical protein [Rhizobium rhizogenes]MDJ1638023.1 hypothetical protein [Rhizobium rhizogenes]